MTFRHQAREGAMNAYHCQERWRAAPGLGKGYGVRPPRRMS